MAKHGLYRVFRTKQELEEYDHINRVVMQQQTLDMVCIALYDRFHFTPQDFRDFQEEFAADWKEMCEMGNEDYKDDKEVVYTKDRIDRKLKESVGIENFVPWDERYRA